VDVRTYLSHYRKLFSAGHISIDEFGRKLRLLKNRSMIRMGSNYHGEALPFEIVKCDSGWIIGDLVW